MKPKITHLSSVHQADDVRIVIKEAASMVENGFDVSVIARADRGDVDADPRVRVVPLTRSSGRLWRFTVSMWEVLALALRERSTVYQFHDSELIGVGIVLRLLGKIVIYDVHEDVPKQIMSKDWIPVVIRSPLANVVSLVESLSSTIFNAVVAATPDIASRFPEGKTFVIQNFPLQREFGGPVENCRPGSRRSAVAYVGGIYRTRGIAEMISAVDIVSQRMDVNLVLAGPAADDYSRSIIADLSRGGRIEYHSWLNRAEVQDLYREVRAGLVLLAPEPRFLTSYPVKMFEYMAAGLPVIASDFPLWREIIEGADCGLLVDPLDTNAIATAIGWILTHPEEAAAMGERGRRAIETTYNWEREAEKLIALYTRLLA